MCGEYLNLVGEEEADALERLLAAIDVVAEEQVVRLGREAAVLEQTQQVEVLAVNVACARASTLNAHECTID